MVTETPKALVSKKKNQGNRSKADCDFNAQLSIDNADTVIDGATLEPSYDFDLSPALRAITCVMLDQSISPWPCASAERR